MNKADLKALFATNKDKDEVHVTSDGVKFWDRHSAANHAKNIGSAVITVSRAEVLAEETPKKEEAVPAVEAGDEGEKEGGETDLPPAKTAPKAPAKKSAVGKEAPAGKNATTKAKK